MFRLFFIFFPLFIAQGIQGQATFRKDTMTLLFMGDIMGHDAQIASARDSVNDTYHYDEVFSGISPLLKNADFAIANLELTLAGKPYTGYPRFSSPDELAVSCLNNGINILMTANNHACDRGSKGIVRTLNMLDFLGIRHTGTFRDSADRDTSNLLFLTKGDLKVGLLNYTFGTNGLPVSSPTIVNRIDTNIMKTDIRNARMYHPDKLIVILHWGEEYRSFPTEAQEKLARFLFNHGVDMIIGSHPHVIERIEYTNPQAGDKEQFIAYSLGNLISNQRTRKRDGGLIVSLTITKEDGNTNLSDYGYYLTWVRKYMKNGKWHFMIIPCEDCVRKDYEGMDEFSKHKMMLFMKDARALLDQENMNVQEIR